jgi:hypothetical protein
MHGLTELLQNLGILFHPHKCVINPTQNIDFLGMNLDIPKQQFRLTEKQLQRLQNASDSILEEAKSRRKVTRRSLAKTIGYYQSCAPALQDGRENLVDLYGCLNQADNWHPKTTVTLSATAIRIIKHFWRNPPKANIGRAWGPQHKVRLLQVVLSTDASRVAWGAHIHGKWI